MKIKSLAIIILFGVLIGLNACTEKRTEVSENESEIPSEKLENGQKIFEGKKVDVYPNDAPETVILEVISDDGTSEEFICPEEISMSLGDGQLAVIYSEIETKNVLNVLVNGVSLDEMDEIKPEWKKVEGELTDAFISENGHPSTFAIKTSDGKELTFETLVNEKYEVNIGKQATVYYNTSTEKLVNSVKSK